VSRLLIVRVEVTHYRAALSFRYTPGGMGSLSADSPYRAEIASEYTP